MSKDEEMKRVLVGLITLLEANSCAITDTLNTHRVSAEFLPMFSKTVGNIEEILSKFYQKFGRKEENFLENKAAFFYELAIAANCIKDNDLKDVIDIFNNIVAIFAANKSKGRQRKAVKKFLQTKFKV